MLKRQESSLSSSSRHENPVTSPAATRNAKAVGCMPTIFQIISKYHNRNKLLTFGRKQEKCSTDKSSLAKAKNAPVAPIKDDDADERSKLAYNRNKNSDTRRLSRDDDVVQRSPMLRPEIRRSDLLASPRAPSSASSIVARLMGLEENIAVKRSGEEEPTAAAEKRMKILQALKKCNDDLESLKKIIHALQSTDARLRQPPPIPTEAESCPIASLRKMCVNERMSRGVKKEELSLLATGNEFTRSSTSTLSSSRVVHIIGRTSQQCKPTTLVKKPGEDDTIRKRYCSITKLTTESVYQIKREIAVVTPSWSSKAMVQSVEEVCNDIAWGQNREVGKIGLALQDHICRDLIEEFVKDMKYCCRPIYSLPLQACKRRLSF